MLRHLLPYGIVAKLKSHPVLYREDIKRRQWSGWSVRVSIRLDIQLVDDHKRFV